MSTMLDHRTSGVQFRLSTLLLVVGCIAVCLALVSMLWRITQVAVLDGRFELSIDVDSASDARIQSMSYATYYKREEAEAVAIDHHGIYGGELEPLRQDGSGFVADVPCSGKNDYYGRELSYSEMRFIVLRCTFADGQQFTKAVEVPKGRGRRSIVVSFP